MANDSKNKAIHAKGGKKKAVVQLGQKAKDDFRYTVSDHNNKVLSTGDWNGKHKK